MTTLISNIDLEDPIVVHDTLAQLSPSRTCPKWMRILLEEDDIMIVGMD